MKKNILELAAIASASVANLNIIGVSKLEGHQDNSALVVDDRGKKWCVRSIPTRQQSGHLDHELQNLKIFTPAVRARLPFAVRHVLGHFFEDTAKTYVYSYLDGTPFDISTLRQKPLTEQNISHAKNIGQCLAALHGVPIESLEANSLPCYRAAEFRGRKLKELDQAAATGRIPTRLLSRWEAALEDVSLWHFAPTVVHGDLNEDNILTEATRITAITGWSNLHGGDPAEDFAWIASLDNNDFKTAVLQSYEASIERSHNSYLLKRAEFHAEFALAQWLIGSLAVADAEKSSEAEKMLKTLDKELRLPQERRPTGNHGEEHADATLAEDKKTTLSTAA